MSFTEISFTEVSDIEVFFSHRLEKLKTIKCWWFECSSRSFSTQLIFFVSSFVEINLYLLYYRESIYVISVIHIFRSRSRHTRFNRDPCLSKRVFIQLTTINLNELLCFFRSRKYNKVEGFVSAIGRSQRVNSKNCCEWKLKEARWKIAIIFAIHQTHFQVNELFGLLSNHQPTNIAPISQQIISFSIFLLFHLFIVSVSKRWYHLLMNFNQLLTLFNEIYQPAVEQ